MRIQYKWLVPIYVFPEMKLLFPKQNYNVLSPSSYTHISVRDLYISRIGLPILLHAVRTVAADLHRGEHIPKMQNNIGRKSMLRVLRQLRSKDEGGGGTGCRTVPYRAVPCRATPRGARPGAAFSTTAVNLRSANSAAASPKTPGGLDPPSFRTVIQYSTICATLSL